MRLINRIIVHCSYTKPSMDVGVEEIRKWHVEENKWSDIGYHFVVRRDGTVESGRPVERPGAHAKNYNNDSIGVCWVGGMAEDAAVAEDNRTADQSQAIFRLLQELQQEFEGAAVLGHRDLKGVKKSCPCFDVRTWYVESCTNTRKKEPRERKRGSVKTGLLNMTFKSLLWITLKGWRLYRYFRRR